MSCDFADRTSQWTQQLLDKHYPRITTTLHILWDLKTEQKKLTRLQTSKKLKAEVSETLGFMEDLGYLYNANLIDREFIRHGAGGLITQYYDELQFWIQFRRRDTDTQPDPRKREKLYTEFEEMAKDIKKTF